MTTKNLNSLTTAITHGSVFHSDDVFATALLMMLIPGVVVKRINDKAAAAELDKNEDTIVYDIGEGEYDHHQKDNTRRPIEDGYWFDKEGRMQLIPYCSFGLLWRDFGHNLCQSDKAWKKVDQTLVLPIDKADNGVDRNTLSGAISQFNPVWNADNSDEGRFEAFMTAVRLAMPILKAYIDSANADVAAEDMVLESNVVDGKILVLDKYVPWQDVVIEQMPEVLYVVFPSARGGYNVQTVPDAPGSFNGRKLFPTKWLGNPDASLGMTFCHPGNFLLATETLEQAVNCARIAAAV